MEWPLDESSSCKADRELLRYDPVTHRDQEERS